MKCRCGKNEAIWNDKLKQFELCDECRSAFYDAMCPKYVKDIGFGDIYVGASLKNFKKEFIEQLMKDTNSFYNNLFLTGDSSVGKTYLMSAICSYLIKHGVSFLEIKYINLIDFINRVDTIEYVFSSYCIPYSKCRYLFLDEIIPVSGKDYNLLYHLLNERMNRGLTTFSSSNYSIDKLNGQIVTRLLANNGAHYELSRRSWSK